MFKRKVKRRVKFGNFWSATHVSHCLQSKQCRQITICVSLPAVDVLYYTTCIPTTSLTKSCSTVSRPAGGPADRCGWLTLPGKQINMNAGRKPNESYISFLPTRNHGNEMSVSRLTIEKREKVQSKKAYMLFPTRARFAFPPWQIAVVFCFLIKPTR
jgi:hypothetical protein